MKRVLLRRMVALAAMGGAIAATGCGDDALGEADGGARADAAIDGGPSAAAPPAPPVMTPCAPGWRELPATDGPTLCEPWPATGMETCTAPDEAHFPGEPGCTRVGTACPVGDFPEDLPAGARVLYVLADAPAGGDGTMALPFATVGEALTRATMGTVIAIGKGNYDGPFAPRAGVTLWGACVAETTLHASTATALHGVIRFAQPDGAVRNLRIVESPTRGIIVIDASATANVTDVVIERAFGEGIAANEGTLTAQGVVVRDTRPNATGVSGRGIQIALGAEASVDRFVVRAVTDQGVLVSGMGTTARFSNGAVVDVTPSPVVSATVGSGWGFGVADTASIELERVVVERTVGGAFVGVVGTTARVEDAVLRHVTAQAGVTNGHGISFTGAALDASRILIEDTADTAITTSEAGLLIHLSDLVIRHAGAGSTDGVGGVGLQVQRGAVCELDRADIRDVQTSGLVVLVAPTSLTARDVAVSDVRADAHGNFGRGLSVGFGASTTIARGRFERVRDVGVVAQDPDTIVTLTDLVVADVRERACATTTCSDRTFGVGTLASVDATLSITRFLVARSTLCGAFVALDASLDLASGEIRESTIGACVQVDGYDVSRLTRDVLYVDNDRNLETTMLPTPDPIVPFP